MTVRILQGDCLEVLKTLPDESVHCSVSSPPYWRQRDYGVAGQLGLERTPEEYVDRLTRIYAEVRRVLRTDGTCWVNLGDKWASGGNGGGGSFMEDRSEAWAHVKNNKGWRSPPAGYKDKDLVGVPWRVAFAMQGWAVIPMSSIAQWADWLLQARQAGDWEMVKMVEGLMRSATWLDAMKDTGWYLRQCNIWAKPNCMPEGVKDRSTVSHEYVFHLTKNNDYWYDAEAARTPPSPSTLTELAKPYEGKSTKGHAAAGVQDASAVKRNIVERMRRTDKQRGHSRKHAGLNDRWDSMTVAQQREHGANLRSVWWLSPAQYREGHFAVMPDGLAELCIVAGCPPGGTVLDPFGGAGTTGLVADRLQRNAILIELNPQYIQMARDRITKDAGMFAEVS